ncbi:MAG: hypothetical protein ABSA91_06300 [Acidimicrobiales bacterium]
MTAKAAEPPVEGQQRRRLQAVDHRHAVVGRSAIDRVFNFVVTVKGPHLGAPQPEGLEAALPRPLSIADCGFHTVRGREEGDSLSKPSGDFLLRADVSRAVDRFVAEQLVADLLMVDDVSLQDGDERGLVAELASATRHLVDHTPHADDRNRSGDEQQHDHYVERPGPFASQAPRPLSLLDDFPPVGHLVRRS